MSNELVKRETTEIVDGFDGTLDDGRVVKGTIILWDREKQWHDRDDQPVPSPLLVYNITVVLRRWVKTPEGNTVPDYITTHPLPDPRDENEKIPKSEWQPGLRGGLRPPWEITLVVYLIEIATGRFFTFQSATTGARIAVDLLREQVAVKRLMVRSKVKPIVELGKGVFKSHDFGIVPRPNFNVVDWRPPESEPEPTPQLPDLSSTATPPVTPAAAETKPKPEAAPPAKKTSKAKAAAKSETKPDAKSDDAVDPYFNDAIPWQ